MPAIIPLIVAGVTGAAGIAAAKMQSGAAGKSAQLQTDAANHAADAQAKSTADALAFSKQQAENAYLNDQATQKANYEQWASGQRLHNSVRDALGYGSAAIPAFQPGVDPNFTGAPGAPAPSGPAPMPSGPPPAPTVAGALNQAPAPQAPRVNPAMPPQPGSVASYLTTGDPNDPRAARVALAPAFRPGAVGSYF